MTADTQAQPFCFNFFPLALCPSGSMDLTTSISLAAHCQAPQPNTQSQACQRAAIIPPLNVHYTDMLVKKQTLLKVKSN